MFFSCSEIDEFINESAFESVIVKLLTKRNHF